MAPRSHAALRNAHNRAVLCVLELRRALPPVLAAVRRAPQLPRWLLPSSSSQPAAPDQLLPLVADACALRPRRGVVSPAQLAHAQRALHLLLRLFSWFFARRLRQHSHLT